MLGMDGCLLPCVYLGWAVAKRTGIQWNLRLKEKLLPPFAVRLVCLGYSQTIR